MTDLGLDIAALQNENERLSKDSTGGDFLANFVKMPEGNGALVLRLLPPAPAGMFDREKNAFYCSTRIHRVNNKSLHCPKELDGGRWKDNPDGIACPICKYYNWLWQESDKKSPDEANQMQANARKIKPIERYYYNVIVRSVFNEGTQEMEKNVGPKILSIGKTLHKMIIRAIVGDKGLDEAPLGDVTDPKTGRDFKLIKTMRQSGRESFPNYSDSKFLDPGPLGDPDEVEKWFANFHDIGSLRNLKSEDELKHELKVHLGLIQDSTTGFDPTEFQVPQEQTDSKVSVSVTEDVPVETETETETTTPEVVATEESVEESSKTVKLPTDDSSESMADDDFLNTLRNLST
jgi:hypothetical protein